MICFSQPRYPGEIQELLLSYGRTTQQSQLLLNNPNSRLTKLIEEGWIEELDKEENQKLIEQVNDKRAKKRQYVQSTLTPIIDYFKTQIQLEKNEERQLKHLFEKKAFRPMFSWEYGFRNFYTVKEFIFQLTFWTTISIKYTNPYRIKEENVSKIGKRKIFSELTSQLLERRNKIAERVAPELKIKYSSDTYDKLYSFISDANTKLKPPLLDKLMKLSNNQKMYFEMALSFLSCGEFMNEFQQKQDNKKNYKRKPNKK